MVECCVTELMHDDLFNCPSEIFPVPFKQLANKSPSANACPNFPLQFNLAVTGELCESKTFRISNTDDVA